MDKFEFTDYESAIEAWKKEFDAEILEYEKEHQVIKEAHTLDEYIYFLKDDFINTTIDDRLEKYVMQLLEDTWFHQWPLVHWAYASRLLRGIWCKQDVERAVDILLPMSEKRMVGAIHDIGYCYMHGLKFEKSYNKCIHLWVKASSEGYRVAQCDLKNEYECGNYKELPDELKLEFLREVFNILVQEKDTNVYYVSEKHDEMRRKQLRRLEKEINKVAKVVQERAWMRESTSLFWNDDENPYKFNIEIKV